MKTKTWKQKTKTVKCKQKKTNTAAVSQNEKKSNL